MVEFYVGNLPRNVTTDEIRRLFSAFGPIEKVFLLTDRTSSRFKGYAVVQMTDKLSTTALDQLARSTIRGRYITILANVPAITRGEKSQTLAKTPPPFRLKGKDMAHLRDEVAQLLPGDSKGNINEAESFLTEIVRLVKGCTNIKNKKLLDLFREAAKDHGLEIEPTAKRISSFLLSAKRKRAREARAKRRSVWIISTPMGGQPPKRQRRPDPLDEMLREHRLPRKRKKGG